MATPSHPGEHQGGGLGVDEPHGQRNLRGGEPVLLALAALDPQRERLTGAEGDDQPQPAEIERCVGDTAVAGGGRHRGAPTAMTVSATATTSMASSPRRDPSTVNLASPLPLGPPGARCLTASPRSSVRREFRVRSAPSRLTGAWSGADQPLQPLVGRSTGPSTRSRYGFVNRPSGSSRRGPLGSRPSGVAAASVSARWKCILPQWGRPP